LSLARDKVRTTDFFCGPLRVSLRTENGELYDKIAETLLLYDFTWFAPYRPVEIHAQPRNGVPPPAAGNFLHCGRMLVDRLPNGLRATTTSGGQATAHFSDRGESWLVQVPDSLVESGKLEEIEDILSLVLTTGWRREGWAPIHAAAVKNAATCAIICAPTGGGKTTLTAALVRRGWRALGDDKILLRLHAGRPDIAALLHTFNLHPRTREWFPEVGDLERLPHYSALTEKRKVQIRSIWANAHAEKAHPSVLIALRRTTTGAGVIIRALDEREVLAALLHQTVIPSDAKTARGILASAVGTAAHLRGLHVDVATDAYRDPRSLDRLESALERHG